MSMLIPVVLCGGAGSRLWPASRDGFPKPFMQLPDGDSLIAKTIRRARAVAPDAPIVFVSGAAHGFLIRNALAAMDDHGASPILLEPVGRNTAPAVVAAAQWIANKFGHDARLLILPADHLIEDVDAFRRSVANADARARAGSLVTFGIVPTAPETGYGYLEIGNETAPDAFRVARFVEKPPIETARAYLASGKYLWNSGMFCFTAEKILTEMAKFAPQVLRFAQASLPAHANDARDVTLDKSAFAQCPSISIDYAVMEKSTDVELIRAAFDWNDVGAWPALAQMVTADARGNRASAQHQMIDSTNVFVQSARTVATVGLSNVVIIDEADALLVANADRAQDVKKVVDALKAAGSTLTNLHMTVHRPWGTYTILEDKADCKVKRIVVNPGASLSLQLHHKRSEHWIVVAGTATVTNGDQVLTLTPGQATFIPVETRHRLENKTNEPVAIIETQVGSYFGEDDIVRFEDRYGRVG